MIPAGKKQYAWQWDTFVLDQDLLSFSITTKAAHLTTGGSLEYLFIVWSVEIPALQNKNYKINKIRKCLANNFEMSVIFEMFFNFQIWPIIDTSIMAKHYKNIIDFFSGYLTFSLVIQSLFLKDKKSFVWS